MERAVSRIRRAVARREPIVVFGDSDVDGLTASVIVYEVLRGLGAVVRVVCANRARDGYGLPASLVRRLCRGGVSLVVLVDCGTNQPEAIAQLAARGIDTVILDHHVPLHGRPSCHALVNPVQGHSSVGTGRAARAGSGLCSAGLALKLAQACLAGEPPERLEPYLDLAALGTLADCAPILADNRTMVALGTRRIVAGPRWGLQRLARSTGVLRADPEEVTRHLIPRLNASGRLGDPSAIWHLLHSGAGTEGEAGAWTSQANTAHETMRLWFRRTIAEAHEQVNRLHFRDQFAILVSRPGWHRGLMGIVASQLAERWQRPAIAVAFTGHQGIGSGRSVGGFDLLQALRQCQDALVTFGGHAQACGLTVLSRQLEVVRQRVNDHAKASLGAAVGRAVRAVDLELPLSALTSAWTAEVPRLAPFGRGNPRPTVVLRGVAFESKSARTGWVADRTARLPVKGSIPVGGAGERYDVVVSPVLTDAQVVLTLLEARSARELSGPVPYADRRYTPQPV